jgi:hypothetical protein
MMDPIARDENNARIHCNKDLLFATPPTRPSEKQCQDHDPGVLARSSKKWFKCMGREQELVD